MWSEWWSVERGGGRLSGPLYPAIVDDDNENSTIATTVLGQASGISQCLSSH